MLRLKKIDSTASERLVFFAFPQKQSMAHKNGNFICRWREIMLDVNQLGKGKNDNVINHII